MPSPTAAVFIPVLNRPHRVEPLLASLLATTRERVKSGGDGVVAPVFICSPSDSAQVMEVELNGCTPLIVDWEPGRADYAKKMNYAWRHTDHDWVLLGADDLVFHPGWLEEALRVHDETHACVIGTNDIGNARVTSERHSTHTMVSRAYGECGTIDDPTVLLHEGYWHNFVDDEFVQTAMHRETWAFAPGCVVEHLHPHWGKAAIDDTYRKGLARFEDDQQTYAGRRLLWAGAGRRTRTRVHQGRKR